MEFTSKISHRGEIVLYNNDFYNKLRFVNYILNNTSYTLNINKYIRKI